MRLAQPGAKQLCGRRLLVAIEAERGRIRHTWQQINEVGAVVHFESGVRFKGLTFGPSPQLLSYSDCVSFGGCLESETDAQAGLLTLHCLWRRLVLRTPNWKG